MKRHLCSHLFGTVQVQKNLEEWKEFEKSTPLNNEGTGKHFIMSTEFDENLGNIHVLRKQVFGIFDPLPPPLSSIVSIWHDPPLVLRKIFETSIKPMRIS